MNYFEDFKDNNDGEQLVNITHITNEDPSYMDTTQFVSAILGILGMCANISFFIYFKLKSKKI